SGMAARPDSPALPPKLAHRLRAQIKAACLPAALMDSLAPEALSISLLTLAARRDGLDPAYGIDPVYASLAQDLHKPIESLESVDLQLKLLVGGHAEELQQGVDKTLRELERGQARTMLLRVAKVWADGRFDELSRYAEWCDCLNTDAERAEFKVLLDDRNPGMADRIDALHAEGRSVFAAVGSLHMTGPAALPWLMAQRGYRVERVDFEH
ncbi:MAG TPA: TraB/GumN family protein, partial [Rhizobacter sp.]|nr:TraB/GumN family protein [Rhizobacter sp.]